MSLEVIILLDFVRRLEKDEVKQAALCTKMADS